LTTAVAANRPKTFVDEVMDATPGHSRLEMCIQCGTCGGSCPSGPDMDHSPRQLFAMIRAGMRKEVLASNTPWYCVSCYFCYVRCPQEVHITDLMYTLKSMAIKEKNFDEKAGAGLAETFTDYVEQDGRSFEFGLATWHNLKHRPMKLPGMAGLGMGMLQKGRMDMTRHKIQGIGQLQAILNKAKEIEETAS